MRTTELAHAALEAEKIRLRLLVARHARRVACGVVAGIFALAVLAMLHVLAWVLLVPRLEAIVACLIVVAFDLVVAVVLGLLAWRSTTNRAEREAEMLKQRALRELRQSLAVDTLIPVAGLIAGRRSGLVSAVLRWLWRR